MKDMEAFIISKNQNQTKEKSNSKTSKAPQLKSPIEI